VASSITKLELQGKWSSQKPNCSSAIPHPFSKPFKVKCKLNHIAPKEYLSHEISYERTIKTVFVHQCNPLSTNGRCIDRKVGGYSNRQCLSRPTQESQYSTLPSARDFQEALSHNDEGYVFEVNTLIELFYDFLVIYI